MAKKDIYRRLLITKEVKEVLKGIVKSKHVRDFHTLVTRVFNYRGIWQNITSGKVPEACRMIKANRDIFDEMINWKAVEQIIVNDNRKKRNLRRKDGFVVNPKKKKSETKKNETKKEEKHEEQD